MKFSELPVHIKKSILTAQKNEITEFGVYSRISKIESGKNREVLKQIAKDEFTHYKRWKNITGVDIKASKFKIFVYSLISRVFGITFGLKLMENGEKSAQDRYKEIARYLPEIEDIIADEDRHEEELLGMLDEEKLNYMGSVVLGLNDALVELTGALAGLSFALQKTKLIAITAFITGIAASFSMAASEYLSTKAENADAVDEKAKSPVKASVYTGIAYIITVLMLILPYMIFNNYLVCLIVAVAIAIFIIFFFNYYISVAKNLTFSTRFFEMLFLSMGVAILSFGVGVIVRVAFNVEV